MRVNSKGFTIVELIVVMVLVGILSTLAAARLMDRGDIEAPAFGQQARSMLRYGQKLAIAQNRPVYVSGTPARIALCFNAACTQRVIAPAGNTDTAATRAACGSTTWYCEGVPAGVTIASAVAGMYFDEQGRPFAVTDPVGSDVSTFASLTITLTGSAASDVIVVEPETGYVH